MHVIIATPGKDGVRKPSITTDLAAAMARSGPRVGVMDADIYGFSIPHMLGVTHEPQVIDGVTLPPLGAQGVRIMSIGMFVPDGQSVIWRGPALHRALQQLLAGMSWDGLNVLLIGIPSGTGDVAISIAQLLPDSQILVATTPQVTAAEIAERTGSIASQTQQRAIGVVGNMSHLPQPDGFQLELFGSGGGASISARLSAQFDYETPLFVQVSLDIALRKGGDVGRPVTLDDGPTSQTLSGLTERLSIVERGLSGHPPGVFPAQKRACRFLTPSQRDSRPRPGPRRVFRGLSDG